MFSLCENLFPIYGTSFEIYTLHKNALFSLDK